MNDSINLILKEQREYFNSNITKSVEFRIQKLFDLKNSIIKYENELNVALEKDLHKSAFESYLSEIGIVLEEINFHIKNIKKWVKPERVGTPKSLFPSKSKILYEPLGVALIISPWNYPVQLLLNPLVGAISAGNCAALKPSPYTPNTAVVLEKMITETFEKKYISIFLGHRDVNQQLLEEKFDFIFFTGSPAMGKVVMQEAAKNLTPMVLELGGKSPCIVDKDADIDIAAKRITWGKMLNAGQTCIAPDYLFVHKDIKKVLLDKLKDYFVQFLGENPQQSPNWGRIVNNAAFERLISYFSKGDIFYGGNYNEAELYISPTIITNVEPDFDIMQTEIFGPILPVMDFDNIDEVISFVKNRPKPLALYYFSKDMQKVNKVLTECSSGGVCINDTIIHIGNNKLPFGGVGNSGLGKYHGRFSFEVFSNAKAVVFSSNRIDIKLKYPPYKNKLELLKKILG